MNKNLHEEEKSSNFAIAFEKRPSPGAAAREPFRPGGRAWSERRSTMTTMPQERDNKGNRDVVTEKL